MQCCLFLNYINTRVEQSWIIYTLVLRLHDFFGSKSEKSKENKTYEDELILKTTDRNVVH